MRYDINNIKKQDIQQCNILSFSHSDMLHCHFLRALHKFLDAINRNSHKWRDKKCIKIVITFNFCHFLCLIDKFLDVKIYSILNTKFNVVDR